MPVYIATTQPRNFDNQTQIEIQEGVRDSILALYGEQAIDFWTPLAQPNGWIIEAYDSGDGVHVNNAGHALLYEQVLAKQIDTLPCTPVTGIFDFGRNDLVGVNLFPNPFDEIINGTFTSDGPGKLEVEMFNQLGQQLHAREFHISGAGEYPFSLDQLRSHVPSIYFVKVTWTTSASARTKTFSLVKQ